MRRIALCLLALCSAQRPVLSTVTYSDGGSHTVSGTSADVLLSNGTTLNIGPGAVITGVYPYLPEYGPAHGGPAVLTGNGNNHIVVTGGSIVGGSNSAARSGGSGIETVSGTLTISGGSITGGMGQFSPGHAVQVIDTQTTISGGSFSGGPTDYRGSGAGAALRVLGGTTTISGGDFFSPNQNGSQNVYPTIDIGGNNLSPAHVRITGGTFTVGKYFNGTLYGSYVLSMRGTRPGNIVDVKGGTFVGGFDIQPTSVLNVFGSNLSLTETSFGAWTEGRLSGTLMDGSPISVITLVSGSGKINLINVPEPSTLALATAGILALAIVARRRTR